MLLQAFTKHQDDLLRFLGRRLGSRVVAEDLVHELYLKLCRTPEPETVRDDRSYLFSMAANLATDYVRVERRRTEIRGDIGDMAGADGDGITPERAALARAELAFLEAEVARLPERCRRVFHLNRYEGWSQAQIAEELGIGLTSVHKDIKLAMATLLAARRRFHGQESEGDG